MTTNFRINGTDTDDLFVRKDLFTEGGLWSTGANITGALGEGSSNNRSSPCQVSGGGTNWKRIGCGGYHTAAIKTDGSLWTWGSNGNGQLGDNTLVHRYSPVQTVSSGYNWSLINAGGDFSAAIKTDGTLWMWGLNTDGQLGVNDIVHRSSPVQIVSGGTNWKQVECGSFHAAAIKTDGTLWLWGNNENGQLGINDIVHRSSPVQTVSGGTNWKQVACGRNHTAAIKTDGTLWLWGLNTDGQLGIFNITHRSSPVQVANGGTDWKQVSCGLYHTAAIKTDGTLWNWGQSTYDQLGLNTYIHKSLPVQTSSGGRDWKQVSCGGYHTAAIKTNSDVYTWGYGASGQLGSNNFNNSRIPYLSLLSRAKIVSSGDAHTSVVREDYWA